MAAKAIVSITEGPVHTMAVWPGGSTDARIWRTLMDICKRLRRIREAKGMSQGDIEERTGLLRCYVSRAECGFTVPQVTTLEK
jgi:hypothetical protein